MSPRLAKEPAVLLRGWPGVEQEAADEWRRRATRLGLLPVDSVRIPLGNPGVAVAHRSAPDVEPDDGPARPGREEAEATREPSTTIPESLEEPEEGEEERPARLEAAEEAYFREIRKVPLLTAAQEVEIGRRIESAQTGVKRALASIPIAGR
jgi:hypothetical protein